MPTQIIISKEFCDDCLKECFFAYNTASGQTEHIESYTEYTKKIEATHFYAGRQGGQYVFTMKRKSAPLNVDWQMLLDSQSAKAETEVEYIDIEQDW